MDITMILTLIMAIIQMIMQFLAGGPLPPPPSDITFPTWAHVSCGQSHWQDNQSSNLYVAGTVVKDCDFYLDAVPISSKSVLERMSNSVQSGIEHTPGDVYDTSAPSDSSSGTNKTYDSTLVLTSDGEQVPVRGAVELKSDFLNSLTTRFASTSIPNSGRSAYLKYVRTQSQVVQTSTNNTYRVRFQNYTTVLHPWFAPSSFQNLLIDQQKAKMDAESRRTLADLLNSL